MISTDRLNSGLIDELAGFGGFVGAGFEFFPVDLYAGGCKDALDGCGYFGSDAFAGDQGDFVWHSCIVLYAKVFDLSKASLRRVVRKEPVAIRLDMQLLSGFAILILYVGPAYSGGERE